MTTTITARVRQARLLGCRIRGLWAASAVARNEHGSPIRGKAANADSWPEAMQLAYKLRADLVAELMDEVHASRASRREAAPVRLSTGRRCSSESSS